MQKHYDIKGKLQALNWDEAGRTQFEVSYDKSGKVAGLKCGDKSYTPEDVDLCGFGGKTSTVKIDGYQDKKVAYQGGKMVESSTYDKDGKLAKNEKINGDSKEVTELFPDGKVKIKASYVNHELNGEEQEFHSSGKLIRKTVWDHGHMENEWTYFLNGSNQSHSVRQQKDKNWFLSRELFWDNGKLKESGTFLEKTSTYSWQGFRLSRWTYNSPTGEHKSYFENGKLSEVEIFDETGNPIGTWKTYWDTGTQASEDKYVANKLQARKEWTKEGKLSKDEQYYEDGSRVNKSP